MSYDAIAHDDSSLTKPGRDQLFITTCFDDIDFQFIMTLLVTLNHVRHSCRTLSQFERSIVQPILVQHHGRATLPGKCRCLCSSRSTCRPVLDRIENDSKTIGSRRSLYGNILFNHPFYITRYNQRTHCAGRPQALYQHRQFHSSQILYDKEPSSKVEQTVNALKEEALKKEEGKVTDSVFKPREQVKTVSVAEVPKRSLSKRVWDEIVHYYHGFRLLFIDIKIATRLLFKSMSGSDLSRREYRQLTRTTADIFRLLPFSIFIIVPFMELLLPVFLNFFPGMLPSTFQSTKDKVRSNTI